MTLELPEGRSSSILRDLADGFALGERSRRLVVFFSAEMRSSSDILSLASDAAADMPKKFDTEVTVFQHGIKNLTFYILLIIGFFDLSFGALGDRTLETSQ